MNEGNKRMNQPRFRSAQWKLIAAVSAMVAALAVVWAVIATLTIVQRDRALEQANERITELRDQIMGRQPTSPVQPAATPPADDSWITEQLDEISAEMNAIIPRAEPTAPMPEPEAAE